MSIRSLTLLILIVAIGPMGNARAGVLPTDLLSSPDIYSSFLTTSYVGGVLDIDGFAGTLENPEDQLQKIWAGDGSSGMGGFSLDAEITEAVGSYVLASGTFEVNGTLTKADSSELLLSGALTAVYSGPGSFDAGGDLQFSATISGGSLAGDVNGPFGLPGSVVVVKINSAGSFFNSSSDIAPPVPEPASSAIFASMLAAVSCGRLRKRSRKAQAS